MHWYTDVLKKYAVFDGRAARPEYWWFAGISALVAFVIALVVAAAAGSGAGQTASDLYALAVLLPGIGVAIRRLHDTNRSGWWILIALIPIIGWIWIIVLMATASDSGPNRYGPNPQHPGPTPRFDSQTGAPLEAPAAPVRRFDPQTGEPLTPQVPPAPETSQAAPPPPDAPDSPAANEPG